MKAQDAMKAEFDIHQDHNSSITFTFHASATAFAFWLDIVNITYIACVSLSFLLLENPESPFFGGSVGLAISSAIGLLGFCQWGMQAIAELENHLISVERVKEYTEIKSEGNLESEKKLQSDWPQNGSIKFNELNFRYSSTSEYVLKNLNFEIKSKVNFNYLNN